MNIDFKGYDEKVLTFECDSTVTEKGQWVQISDNGKVSLATDSSPLTGVTVNVRGDYCGVMLSGVVTVPKSGDVSLGYSKLVYTEAGITQNTVGREHLVLAVTDDTVTFVL